MNAFPSLEWGTANAMNTHLTNEEINSGIRNRNLGRLYKMMTRRASANYPERLAAAEAAKANANARMAANAASRATRTWKNNNNNTNAATRRLHNLMKANAANAERAAKKVEEAKATLKEAKAARSQVVSGMTQNQKEAAIRSILSSKGDYRMKQAELMKQIPHMSSRIAKGLTNPGANIGRALKDLKKAENKAATASGASAAAASENAANVLALPSQEAIQTYYATKLSEKEQGGRRRTRRRRSSRRKSMKKRQ